MCPGLFPGVTPFRRAGGAHVVPETLSLHISGCPVSAWIKGTLRPLTLHVPYSGCECCRSQLEAHSFSYKPIPTTDGRWNALSCCLRFIYPGPAAPPRRGRCKGSLRDHSACWYGRKYQVPTSRILLLRPDFTPLLFSAQTEKIAFNAVGFRHVRSGIFGRGAKVVMSPCP